MDGIGDLVTLLLADEDHPIKKDGPVVEEIKESAATIDSDSDSGYEDVPDLE